MNDPRRWTASELTRDVEQAKAEFRRRRLHEPLDVYSRLFRISENRNPTEHERMRAVIVSAVLVTARKVETSRRSDAKRLQEEAVKAMLRDLHFIEAEPRDIPILDAAPSPAIQF